MKKLYLTKHLALIAGCFMMIFSANAQTVLISPTGDGGFENGPDFISNGWTVDNGTVTNQWHIDNVLTGFTNNSAFISDDAGITNAYTNSSISVVHFYRDITFPAGETAVNLSFDWQSLGETSFWDGLLVSLSPTSYIPTASSTSMGTGNLPSPAIELGRFWGSSSVQTNNIAIPPSVLGNCSAPNTMRLIFTWKNDGSLGTNPPAAIDNIQLVSAVLSPSPTAGTFTIDNTQATAGTNFNSFTDAINWLNNASFCGSINNSLVFNVADGQLFNELPPAIMASGTSTNTITFQKSGTGVNPILRGLNGVSTSSDACLAVIGGDYFTFNGIDVEDDAANTSSTTQMEYGYLIRNADAIEGATNNVIKNCRVSLNITRTAAIGILVSSSTTGGGSTPTAITGSNNDNLIDSVFVENCGLGGILVKSGTATYPGLNNIASNSVIGAGYTGAPNGSIGTGSTAAYGIMFDDQSDFLIRNNTVRNLVTTTTKRGIYVSGGQGVSHVNNNIVHGLRNTSTTSTTIQRGMDLSLSTTGTHNLKIYNNFISDITSAHSGTASSTRALVGLDIGSGSATSIYDVDFNSISIDGSGSLTLSNSCMEIGGSTAINNIRNNVFANYTNAQTGTPKHFCIRSSSATAMGAETSVVDNNDYYLLNSTNGFTALTSTTTRATITDWDNAIATPSAPIDVNSVAVDPQFFDTNLDLHTFSSNLSTIGNMTGISWVADDIDGDTRTSPHSIGADHVAAPTTIDMGAIVLNTPLTTGCYTSAENVSVKIKNYGTLPIDFSADNTTVTLNVTGAITQTFTVVLIDNSLNGGIPLATDDSLDVPLGILNMSTTGTYTFDAFTSVGLDGSALNDNMATVNIAIDAGSVTADGEGEICAGGSITLTAAGYSGGILQWEESTDNIAWTTIVGATASTYLYNDNSSTSTSIFFRVVDCGLHFSISDTVFVNFINAPLTTGATRCGAGQITLSASGPGPLKWFDAPTAGTQVNTGTTFTTSLSSTTSYYVENSTNIENVGSTNQGTSSFLTQTTGYGLFFTANNNFTLNSVTVYPTGTGTITVHILDPSNNILSSSAPFPVSGSGSTTPVVLPLNIPITPGNYKIGMSSTGITNLVRSSSGNTYPYTPPSNVVSITSGSTGSGTSTSYYWFFDWEISTGCNSGRTQVTATVTPADTVIATASSNTICSNTSTTITMSSLNPGYSYTWSPATGLNTTSNDTVIANPAATTTYTVAAIDNITGCETSTNITITVEQGPVVSATVNPPSICSGTQVQFNVTSSANYSYSWSPGIGMNDSTIFNPTASPATSGTYSATVTNTVNGCISLTSVAVVVNPSPVANAGADQVICPGDAATLDAGAGLASYEWTFGSFNSVDQAITVTPGTTTFYILNVTDMNGCSSSDGDTVLVTVESLPAASFTQVTTGINDVAFTNTTTGNLPFTSSWNFGDGSPLETTLNASHTYSSNGVYTATLTVTNDCGTTIYTEQVVITGVDITEESALQKTVVYPNPSLGMFNLVIENANMTKLGIIAFDLTGRVLFSSEEEAKGDFRKELNFSSFAKGVYYLKLESENSTEIRKLIIQ